MAKVTCNNDDCIYCVDDECIEENVELVCESGNYLDDDMNVHSIKNGVLYCESYIEKQ